MASSSKKSQTTTPAKASGSVGFEVANRNLDSIPPYRGGTSAADFDIGGLELFQGSIKGAVLESAGGGKGDLWKVPLDQIFILPGWNVRDETARYAQHRENITQSIMKNGFDLAGALQGYARAEDLDGGTISRVYITDGHTRLSGAREAVRRGCTKLGTLQHNGKPWAPMTIQIGLNLEQLILQTKRRDLGLPHTAVENARFCQRLAMCHWEPERIAEEMGYSLTYVKSLLLLIASPPEYLQFVIDDKVAATEAMKLLTSHGPRALSVLKQRFALAQSTGKSKVTAALDPAKTRFMAAAKKHVAPMADVVVNVKADPGFLALSPENQKAIGEIADVLAKAQEAKKVKAAKPDAAAPPAGDKAQKELPLAAA